jgi:hypothetical protein
MSTDPIDHRRVAFGGIPRDAGDADEVGPRTHYTEAGQSNSTSQREFGMEHRRLAATVGLLALGLGAFATPGAAGATSTCPDGMIVLPASLVPQGSSKDKNGNALICAKVDANGNLTGGPDDRTDDIVL